MSATQGLGNNTVVQFNSAEGVQQQIQSTSEQIRGLGQDLIALGAQLQALVAELQALQPPAAPGANASKSAKAAYQNALNDYNRKVADLQGKINDVNARSREVTERMNDLQVKVDRLKSSDLPAAERADNLKNEEQLKNARDNYDATARTFEKEVSSSDEAVKTDSKNRQMRLSANNTDSSSTTDRRLTLRLTQHTAEVKLDKNTDLKTVVKFFQIAMVAVGDGADTARRANPATQMPYTPGLGLPPIDTP